MGRSHHDGDNDESTDRRPDDESATDRRTRRRYLAGLAAAGSVAIAGCGGGGGGGDDGGSDDGSDDDDSRSDPSNGSSSDGTGSGDETPSGCPDDLTFVTQGYSALGDSGHVGQCEIPEAAQVRSGGGEGSMNSQVTAVHEYPNREYTSISVQGNLLQDEEPPVTVDSRIQTQRETADQTDWFEVTDRFDLAVGGTRVIASSEDAVPTSTIVVSPVSGGVLQSSIDADSSGCQAAAERFYVRVVETIQPV